MGELLFNAFTLYAEVSRDCGPNAMLGAIKQTCDPVVWLSSPEHNVCGFTIVALGEWAVYNDVFFRTTQPTYKVYEPITGKTRTQCCTIANNVSTNRVVESSRVDANHNSVITKNRHVRICFQAVRPIINAIRRCLVRLPRLFGRIVLRIGVEHARYRFCHLGR